MDGKTLQIFIAMVVYILAVIGIGLYYMKRANKNSENFFIGGRGLGPWVAAMSAEASDMSGWLLMGLPGVAYWCGLADALWTAAGLAIGTYINWLIVARRLRQYSVVAGDAITIPDFFSNRFREKKKVIMMIAAIFILVFFTVYAGSCFVTCGKLFSTLFGMPYQAMMIAGALFVIPLYLPRRVPGGECFGFHAGHCHDFCPERRSHRGGFCGGRPGCGDEQHQKHSRVL